MNNKGRGFGLALVIILIVAVIIALLAVKNMSSLGFGNNPAKQEQQQDYVEQAKEVVDMINAKMQQAEQEP